MSPQSTSTWYINVNEWYVGKWNYIVILHLRKSKQNKMTVHWHRKRFSDSGILLRKKRLVDCVIRNFVIEYLLQIH